MTRAVQMLRCERIQPSLEATQLALTIDDRNAVYYMLRGRVQLARREYESALVDNERAIELNQGRAAMMGILGVLGILVMLLSSSLICASFCAARACI